jgi:hypothetical protein
MMVDAATTAVGTASSILADRSDAMVILVGLIGLAAFWLWKIHLPQKQSEQKLREADKEIHQTNAATLAELSKVTTGIHQTTLHTNTTLRAIVEVEDIKLECIGMIADATKCDVRDQLAEARGVMRAVRVGATSDS